MHTHDNDKTSSIEQNIFTMDLSVETISIYLLCCGLVDAGQTITNKNLLEIWNGTEAGLISGIQDLESKNILLKIISDRQENNVYKLIEAKQWKNS